MSGEVRVRREPVVLPTYEPEAPDRNPMFLEKRVYQGSSGRVYPLPVFNRISEAPTDREWDAIYLDNGLVEVMLLPEIGGRVHAIRDLSNSYEAIYRQHVIKPALVGLGGPWVSGGIEFNWPQHHRPSTFMPADVAIQHDADGSITVWMGEHEPMDRTKGMHGICLHPGRSVVEIKARLYNRTPYVQTFLWWTNIGIHVHEAYRSFFPPDCSLVADHAKRAISSYPLCDGHYYGVDYASRARDGVPEGECPSQFVPSACGGDGPPYAPNDLSWYANIPVPTSYMCVGTEEDFVGGYDFFKRAGLMHVADHHIAPGKKQWTWGNQEFGYAWDRNLTDADGPYIEIMAGVYTDNQPDFSFIAPGETRTFSQFLYPFREIGVPVFANVDVAISLGPNQVGVASTRRIEAVVEVANVGSEPVRWNVELGPDRPLVREFADAARMSVFENGRKIGSHARPTEELPSSGPPHEPDLSPPRERSVSAANRERGTKTDPATDLQSPASVGPEVPRPRFPSVTDPSRGGKGSGHRDDSPFGALHEKRGAPTPMQPAIEPPLASEVASNDELFTIGQHLEQYRHATRSGADYWREALRRDPGDSRSNNALGMWHLKRGEFGTARALFLKAIERATSRNPNPYDGEPYYNLGLACRFLGQDKEAFDAFAKATWNASWQAPAHHALGELACKRGDWPLALHHLDKSIRKDQDNLRARNLRTIVLRKLGRRADASENLTLDPLDHWARHLGRGQGLEMVPLLCGGTVGEGVRSLPSKPQVDRAAHPHANNGVKLDIAIDLLRAGLYAEVLEILALADDHATDGTAPLLGYYRAHALKQLGQDPTEAYAQAAATSPDYCFPSRLEDIGVLQEAPGHDSRAAFYLGNLFYDRRRYVEAIEQWEKSVRINLTKAEARPSNTAAAPPLPPEGGVGERSEPGEGDLRSDRVESQPPIRNLTSTSTQPDRCLSIALRNLGIAAFNVQHDTTKARTYYDQAIEAAPEDARLWYERDQLWKRLEVTACERLTTLRARPDLVLRRDDLTLEYCSLLNETGEFGEAERMLDSRRFQPWEGGESIALRVFTDTELGLGHQALARGDAAKAKGHFHRAAFPPENLGEARHLLANASDLWLACGDAAHALGESGEAQSWWRKAAEFKGDFQEMAVQPYSELTYHQILALQRLGRTEEAEWERHNLKRYAEQLLATPAKIDYFATSLPTMLLFDDDLQARQESKARLILGQIESLVASTS